MLVNTGTISGGLGAAGGQGSNGNGSAGPNGDGVLFSGAAGTLINGSKSAPGALVTGLFGVYARAGSTATVVNYGILKGTGGVAVQFNSAADRLILETGAVLVGVVDGGGGTLELAGTAGTLAGLGGGTITVSGATALTASGLGAYQLDAGGWTLSGANTLTAAHSLIDGGSIILTGSLTNQGTVKGLAGAAGGAGAGGAGSAGFAPTGTGSLANQGLIVGGAGGAGGVNAGKGQAGGVGGAGLLLTGTGVAVSQAGTLSGGAGGVGGTGAAGGVAGAGLALLGGGGFTNIGAIKGGAGGLANSGAGVAAAAGDGVILTAGGTLVNGASYFSTCAISGYIGVYAGPGGAATIKNFGTISGTSASVKLASASDRVISEAGASFVGVIQGGGGTFEIATGSATLYNLGATGTLSGDEHATFTGFNAYVFDSAWGLSGANTLAAGKTILAANSGDVVGAFTNLGSIGGNGGIYLFGGSTMTNGAAIGSAAFESGKVGVYLGPGYGPGAGATLTNFGTIQGTGGTAVDFFSSQATLVAEAGSVFIGAINGNGLGHGGGTLQLLAGAATGTIDGASGLGTVTFAAGASWEFDGSDTFNGGLTVTGGGAVIVGGVLSNGGVGPAAVDFTSGTARLVIKGGASVAGGAIGDGATSTLELAGGTGTISGLGSSFTGFGAVVVDAGGAWTLAGADSLAAGQSLINNGALTVGGSLVNQGSIASGTGIMLAGSGNLTNAAGATIAGASGVYAGVSTNATITNFGAINAAGGTAVQFKSSSDRLIVENGGKFIGAVQGGGGTLEVVGGTGTITGLGATGTLSGADSMTFSGFGAYVIDGSASLALTGAAALAAGKSLTVGASLINSGTVTQAGSGAGITLVSGGMVTNAAGALISGATGVYGASGPATVVNAGTLQGTGGVAVQFKSAADRLVVETGAAFVGAVQGGGGTLELATAPATITGLGTSPTISNLAATLGGFGTYALDGAGSWTLAGANTLTAAQSLIDNGMLTLIGSLTSQGAVSAAPGAVGGGAGGKGLIVAAGGVLANSGAVTGGAGGAGGTTPGNGQGGLGVDVTAGGALSNSGNIVGGQGGSGVSKYFAIGYGGVGVYLRSGAGAFSNTGTIAGGAGAANTYFGGYGGNGLDFYGPSLTNAGTIVGGQGGGGSMRNGGQGGGGLELAIGGSFVNTGAILGGVGGAGGIGAGRGGYGLSAPSSSATVNNAGLIQGGAGGSGTSGAYGGAGALVHGGRVINTGTIAGGAGRTGSGFTMGQGVYLTGGGSVTNGSSVSTSALIVGSVGVLAGASGAATVTNFGSIQGAGAASILFLSASDRLIAESGSTFIGAVKGGGGTLELAKAVGTITGLGATGTLSGAEAMTFSGFGSYVLDAKGSWTLAGTNALAAGATLTDNGALTNDGALTLAGTVSGNGALAFAGGTEAIDGGAKLSVSNWSLAGGAAVSVNEALTYAKTFTDGAATLSIGAGDTMALTGASTFNTGAVVNGAGRLSLKSATLSGLTVGGTAILTDTGTIDQTGQITIGDATTAAARLVVAKGATYKIDGNVGITRGAATTSSLSVTGSLVRASGKGTSRVGVTVTDNGLIEAATGTLDFTSALKGNGTLKIDAGATLEAASTAASTLTATFNGTGGTLALGKPARFAATISGYAAGDTIDLIKTAATGASVNGGDQLVIVNGLNTVATLQLTGSYAGATFTVASDGHGGSAITVTGAARVPPASASHQFIAAMAGMGAEGSASIHAGDRGRTSIPTMLAAARHPLA